MYTDGGVGASDACVAMTVRELKKALSRLTGKRESEEGPYTVEKTDAAAVKGGVLKERCQLLVLPGGRDLPYCSRLNGTGNEQIRDFVKAGGSYLGLCAGGYYGASYVQFAVGDPVLEVVGPRELKFYPGVARGPTFPGFRYDNHAGARACAIALEPSASLLKKACHFETTPPLTMYYNGGGYFTAGEREHDSDISSSTDKDSITDIKVLATYDVSSSQRDIPKHTDPDAPLSDSPAAIVSMQYGAGKVILSGVHPESSAAGLAEVYSGDTHIEALLSDLEASEAPRASVFDALLSHLLY